MWTRRTARFGAGGGTRSVPAGLGAEHGPQPDQDLVRGVAVALRVHRSPAGVHILREQEVVADPRAVLAAQLDEVSRDDLAAHAQAPAPREHDAVVTVL